MSLATFSRSDSKNALWNVPRFLRSSACAAASWSRSEILVAVCAATVRFSATRIAADDAAVRIRFMAASSVAWARGSIGFMSASSRGASEFLESGRRFS